MDNNRFEDDEYCADKDNYLDEDEDDDLFSQRVQFHCPTSKSVERFGGGADFFAINDTLSDLELAFNEGFFEDNEEEDEDETTKFVLQTLAESRDSLKKLLRNQPEYEAIENEELRSRLKEADVFVQSLKEARVVYRIFDHPVGNIRNVPLGVKYCIQGFFLPAGREEYHFLNFNPLVQYRCISPDGTLVEALHSTVVLDPTQFERLYDSKLAVLEAGDLAVHPPLNTPCLNTRMSTITSVAPSVVTLASEISSFGNVTSSMPVSTDEQCANKCSQVVENLELPLIELDAEGQDRLTSSSASEVEIEDQLDDISEDNVNDCLIDVVALERDDS